MPGEIWRFMGEVAEYPKYYLCVSDDPLFLIFNSPKHRTRDGDLTIDERAVPRLPKTAGFVSILCCTKVVGQPADVVLEADDEMGTLRPDALLKIADFIEDGGLIERRLCRPWLQDLREWAENARAYMK